MDSNHTLQRIKATNDKRFGTAEAANKLASAQQNDRELK